MRRVTPLLLLCTAASTRAAMPVYNTDQIAQGEALVAASVSRAQPESDTDAVISGGQFTGHTKDTSSTGSVQFAYGFSRRLTGYVGTAYTDATEKESLNGPASLTFDTGTRGWEDVDLTLEYLAFDDATTPVVARLAVIVPTASDFQAQSGITLNGVQIAAKQAGSPGSGQTGFVPQLAGSVKGQGDALEWSLYWQTDDDKATKDGYQGVLGWVHNFTPETYVRLSGAVYFRQGMNAHGETTNDTTSYAAGLSLAHQFGGNMRVVASYTYFRPDAVHATFSNGSVIDQRNQTSQQGSLGIDYLFN